MRAVLLFRSVILAVLAMAGASAAVAAKPVAQTYPVQKKFAVADIFLGMSEGQVRQIVARKVSPFSANQPRFDYNVSTIFGREFEPRNYLSKVTFVPDLPGGPRVEAPPPPPRKTFSRPGTEVRDFGPPPKPSPYTVEVYLTEIDPGNGAQPVSVVTQVVARFTGEQTALNNKHPYVGQYGTKWDYPNDTAIDRKLGIFVLSAKVAYGEPSIDNTSLVGTRTWYTRCVLDGSRNYRAYQCHMARANWCSSLAGPGENPYECGPGAYLSLNRNQTEVRLVDDAPYYPQERVLWDDGNAKLPPFTKVQP